MNLYGSFTRNRRFRCCENGLQMRSYDSDNDKHNDPVMVVHIQSVPDENAEPW